MGIIAALRSISLRGCTAGLMVTASHNPEEDNGIKMVDACGDMLASDWEPICTRIANADSYDQLLNEIHTLIQSLRLDMSANRRVIYACDTRPSSPALVRAVEDGLQVMGAEAINAGLLTTPQLHFLVMARNSHEMWIKYGHPDKRCYYQKLSKSFVALMQNQETPMSLVVDCANGVGALALQELLDQLPSGLVDIKMLRTSVHEQGKLNNGCGADYVKSNQRLPIGYDGEADVKPGTLLCSFDGDADRIVSVSYTHLTLPTILLVQILGGAHPH